MSERFDAIIIGAGPGGEVALNTLAKEGARIALLEQELIGGECSNWGCIPSKTLLRPTELKGKSMRAAGIMTPPPRRWDSGRVRMMLPARSRDQPLCRRRCG